MLPALIQLLGATTHDGCRCAVLAALKTQISSPGTSDFRRVEFPQATPRMTCLVLVNPSASVLPVERLQSWLNNIWVLATCCLTVCERDPEWLVFGCVRTPVIL